ncbi:calmodulin-A-like [Rhopilema esculentum]|uniref:calmodulin-A-like n=1 Tax=Rhopilema esculentum TaxID=499914 RepID=UPI0031E3B4B4
MSYWGSHYSALPKETEEAKEQLNDSDKQLCDEMNLSREQFEELKECFKLCDKSGKGKVSPMEIKALMKSVGEDPDDEDIHEMMLEIDPDGKGEIDFMLFLNFMHKTIKAPIQDDSVEQCFRVFDDEDNGYITIRGLERVFLSFGQQHSSAELREMISFIDTDDEEGLISINHFKAYIEKQDLLRRKDKDSPENKGRGPVSMRKSKKTK